MEQNQNPKKKKIKKTIEESMKIDTNKHKKNSKSQMKNDEDALKDFWEQCRQLKIKTH